MKHTLLLLLVAFTSLNSFGQTTYIFNGDGDWTDTAQWQNGIYPGTTIGAADFVGITGKLTIAENTTVNNNGTIESYNTQTTTPQIKILGALVNNKDFSLINTIFLVDVTGRVLMNGTSTLDISSSSTLTNTGSFVIFGGTVNVISIFSSLINDGSFQNNGTVQVYSGKFTNKSNAVSTSVITINNNGSFNNATGEIINNGVFKNNASGILLNERTFSNKTTGTIENYGQITISDSSTLINEGNLNNSKNINLNGYSNLNIETNSTFTNQNTGLVVVGNNGQVRNKSNAFNIVGGKFTNNGKIDSENTITIGSAGNLENNGTLTCDYGSIISNLGTLSGINTVHDGTFSNNGKLSPGNTTDATGFYKMDSFFTSYTQTTTGSLNIDLEGTVAGNTYDQLIVNKNATLNGTLNVSLLNGFEPAIGDAFKIISQGGGVSGSFTTVNLPTLSGNKIWDVVEYSNTDGVSISVIEKSTLSISNVSALNFKLYPNPVSDKIFVSGISATSSGNIYDLQGRKVLDVIVTEENTSIDLSTLTSGIYLFKIKGETFKFVKR